MMLLTSVHAGDAHRLQELSTGEESEGSLVNVSDWHTIDVAEAHFQQPSILDIVVRTEVHTRALVIRIVLQLSYSYQVVRNMVMFARCCEVP